jgi:hypothetical protein
MKVGCCKAINFAQILSVFVDVFIDSLSRGRCHDQQLDKLMFYAGAFAYVGQLEFGENGCNCGEILEANKMLVEY